jgi:small-conductance mechanosensitive channel
VLGILLGRFQRSVPTVLRTVLTLLSVVVGAFVLLGKQGFDLKSLLPTGAVITGVLGLALQQTLGNLIGGLSIQMDKSVRVGDWVSVDNLYGRVSAIRWRSSTLETNDFEAIVVPNSVLLGAKLLVRGRRWGRITPWRRWVRFRLPFDAPPVEVMRISMDAVLHEPIEYVAKDPSPDCLLLSLEDGVAVYALRYYLEDFIQDDATDSAVRLRLLYALRRAGFEPALPSRQVRVTDSSAEKQALETETLRRQEARESALRAMELFSKLTDSELKALAIELKDVPFAPGESLCRQGEAADSLYILQKGRVSVRVASASGEHEVAQLGPEQFFGEMGLMTGEPRTATVRALGHVDAYRLEKEAFRHLLARRPELAESLAEVLATRRAGLDQTKESMDLAARERRQNEHRNALLVRIKEFLGKRPDA